METKLWAMLIPGPDDVWAMPSKEAAEEAAAKHNKAIETGLLAERFCLPKESVQARVIEWPYSAAEHAEALNGPGDGDDVPCVKCGQRALDTGLECTECGHDNHEAVTGKPFVAVPICSAQTAHSASADCWCQPEVDYVDPDTGATVYVHRATQ